MPWASCAGASLRPGKGPEMQRHVSEEEWVDLLSGGGDPEARHHVARCASCARTLEELQGAWESAGDAEVPEPSPLYWESFRRGVGRRIDEERRGNGPLALWPRWALLTAGTFAVAAALFLARLPEGPSG